MSHCPRLSIVLKSDFIMTYLELVFFVTWILAKIWISRLSNVFRRVRESRNRQIHRRGA